MATDFYQGTGSQPQDTLETSVELSKPLNAQVSRTKIRTKSESDNQNFKCFQCAVKVKNNERKTRAESRMVQSQASESMMRNLETSNRNQPFSIL